MNEKEMELKKAAGKVRVSKEDRKKLIGKTNWTVLAEQQRRDKKP